MPSSVPADVKAGDKPAAAGAAARPAGKQPTKAGSPTKPGRASPRPAGEEMGARFSSASPGSAGKAPSTVSASSTHTASTVPADSAESKSKTLPSRTGGVAGFLRRKTKAEPGAAGGRRGSDPAAAAGPSTGHAAKKPAKKSVGSSLRTSLFKRSTKGKGAGSGAPEAAAAPSASSAAGGAASATNASSAAGVAAAPAAKAAETTASSAVSSTNAGGAGEPHCGKAPGSGPAKPPSGRASPEKAATKTGSVSPPKPQRQGASSGNSHRKSPSPKPGTTTATGRGSQALTPERKEALKKQWFTDGQPLPKDPVVRKAAPGPVMDRKEPRSKPGAGETVGPPAKASRVEGSSFSKAAAKFGGSKAPAKPRPGSPKKTGETKKDASGDGMGDLMSAMAGFEGSPNGKEDKTKTGAKDKMESKQQDDIAKGSKDATVVPKVASKVAGSGGDLSDLMGAMDGFNPGGSKDEKIKTGDSKKPADDAKVLSEKDKDDKQKGTGKSSKIDSATDSKGVSSSDTSAVKVKKAAKETEESSLSKPDKGSTSQLVMDDKTSGEEKDAIEPKADKKTTWRHGEDDSGELGLGGISQKDREERAQKPSAPKAAADLDFLSSLVETAPKPSAKDVKEAKPSPKKDEKSRKKDEGLGDLMDLAQGFDMSAKAKSEPVAAASVPEMAQADMDKFLDFMDTNPPKPSAPPIGKEVEEEAVKEKKTWRTGDGDDEAMIALMNKERDFDAPAQAADWNIDDLLVDKVARNPDSGKEKEAAKKEKGDKKVDKQASGGFSAFDDFIGSSMSDKPAAPVEDIKETSEKKVTGDSKKNEGKEEKKESLKKGEGLSAFDDFMADSLAGKDSEIGKNSKKLSKEEEKKEASGKKSSDDKFSGFDDFMKDSLSANDASIASSVKSHEEEVEPPKSVTTVDAERSAPVEEAAVASAAASQTTAAPGKRSEKHAWKEGDTRGSVPDHDHGIRDLLYDDSDKTGKKKKSPSPDPKKREPAALDDLIRPAKASSTSAAPTSGHEEQLTASTAHSTEGAASSKGKRDAWKEGDTRGSVPDHGHGVRDVLYDDSDKTGKKKSSGSKGDNKPKEPAILDDLIQPKKASSSHAEPVNRRSRSPSPEREIKAKEAHKSEASGGDRKKAKDKRDAWKEGDTRGSVPDHGHGVRDLLYDDSDKTGKKKSSGSESDKKPRECAVLDDLIQPTKASSTHAKPSARKSRSPSPQDKISASTAHQSEASSKSDEKDEKAKDKRAAWKDGDLRGSVPDHSFGVRDVLYDDSDKTGRKKSGAKDEEKPRECAMLDDLVQPKTASVSHTESRKSSSPEKEISATSAHKSEASDGSPRKGKGKKRNKKQDTWKEGDTRGSVPDHGHELRDVLYDDSDKTGREKSGSEDDRKAREPAVLDDLIQPKSVAHVSSAPPPSHPADSTSRGEEEVVAKTATTAQSAPPPAEEERPKKSLSLAGMTDPDEDDDDDGELLRRLIASTDSLQARLQSSSAGGDSSQVEEEADEELNQLEQQLEQKQQRLEAAGRGKQVQEAKEGLKKAKQQLEASRQGKSGH